MKPATRKVNISIVETAAGSFLAVLLFLSSITLLGCGRLSGELTLAPTAAPLSGSASTLLPAATEDVSTTPIQVATFTPPAVLTKTATIVPSLTLATDRHDRGLPKRQNPHFN